MWSVVTVAKGMWPVTEKMLDSLLATIQVDQVDRIVYCDNGTPPSEDSWDRSWAWEIDHSSIFQRIRYARPMSLSLIWNEAVRCTYTDYVLVCNNDVIFHKPGWLDEFEQALNEPGIGVVGLVGMSWKNTPFIQGSVMAFKRSTFDAVGGFDEQFEFTVEDVDFSKRVMKLGLIIKSFEKLRDDGSIEHIANATRNYYKDDLRHYQYLGHLSRLRFCYKYFDELGGQIQIHD
jgi:hypothetical protein